MNCDTFQAFLPDMLLDPACAAVEAPPEVRKHLAECAGCRENLRQLQATMQLLDTWEVPEPSPYFDTRMAARLREEKSAQSTGWLAGIRARLLLAGSSALRPVLAAALALVVIVGVASFEGHVSLNGTAPAHQTVSATVNDLELLDRNAQTLEELAAFDNPDITAGQGTIGSNPD